MSIKEIKSRARTAFKANYWRSVIAALLLILLAGGAAASSAGNTQNAMSEADTQAVISTLSADQIRTLGIAIVSASIAILVIGIVLRIFVFNPLKVGAYRFFNKNVVDSSTTLATVKEGFGSYGHTLVTLFLTDLFLVLWSVLFIIPGIIKAYSYRLVPYLLRDKPELSAMEAIRRSKELMSGNKWRAFVLDLSFIGWFLLGAVTFGIVNLFWTNPYLENAHAAFYHDVKA